MPPPKPKTAPDDSRSEASSTREKYGNVTGLNVNGKGRRAASGLGTMSTLRDSAHVAASAMMTAAAGIASAGQDVNAGVRDFYHRRCQD
jgi:hypothetical protein